MRLYFCLILSSLRASGKDKTMQNWKNRKTYRRIKNPDGSYTYLIKVEGKYVPVNKDVYTAYTQSEEQLEYIECKLKRNRMLQDASGRTVMDEDGQPIILPEREVSLDKLMAEDWDYPSSAPSPEDIILKEMEITALHRNLDFLNTDERALIEALFFEGLTEREYSNKSGIPQKTINDRKNRILKKLYQLMQK